MTVSTAVLIEDTVNRETNTVNRTEKNLMKIPIGWRLTSNKTWRSSIRDN